jgi:anti-sigma B factor antagonist
MEGIQTTIKFTGPGDSIAVIKVGGYIDTTTSSELERALSSLIKKEQYRIVVDLADVDYISSAGWGIFISEIKGIKQNRGDLKLVKMIPEVYEVFELLEFHYILKAYDTLEESVDAFIKESGGNLQPVPKAVVEAVTSPNTTVPPQSKTQETKTKTSPTTSPKVEEDDDEIVHMEEETVASIDDHIRSIVAKYPDFGAWQIKKMLNTAQYDYTRIGWFDIRKKLKDLKLLSKQNRYDYAAKQD